MEEPEIPEFGRYLWEWFVELHSGRSAGMAGPDPISWRDIADWSALTGIKVLPWEVRAIRAMDNGFLSQ